MFNAFISLITWSDNCKIWCTFEKLSNLCKGSLWRPYCRMPWYFSGMRLVSTGKDSASCTSFFLIFSAPYFCHGISPTKIQCNKKIISIKLPFSKYLINSLHLFQHFLVKSQQTALKYFIVALIFWICLLCFWIKFYTFHFQSWCHQGVILHIIHSNLWGGDCLIFFICFWSMFLCFNTWLGKYIKLIRFW